MFETSEGSRQAPWSSSIFKPVAGAYGAAVASFGSGFLYGGINLAFTNQGILSWMAACDEALTSKLTWLNETVLAPFKTLQGGFNDVWSGSA